MIFKESLRIGQVSSTPEQDREKIKQVSVPLFIYLFFKLYTLISRPINLRMKKSERDWHEVVDKFATKAA